MATNATTDYAMLSLQLQRLSDELTKSQNKQTTDLMASQERIAYAGETRGLRSTDLIVDNVRNTSTQVKDAVINAGNQNLLASERIGGAASVQAERIYGQVQNAVEKTTNALQMQAERINSEQLGVAERIASASSVQAERIGSAIGTQNERIAGAASIQAERIASALGSQSERIGHSVESLIDRNFSATLQGLSEVQKMSLDQYGKIQLEALKNKEDLAKQSASQTAELKDTLAKNEMDRLRDQLRKSETKELIYKHCHDHGDYYHHGHHGHHHRRGRRWGGDWDDGNDDVNVRVSQTVYPPFYPPFFGPGPFPPGPPFGAAGPQQGPQGGR